MTVSYEVQDEKFVNVKKDGKPVMKSFQNALAKAQTTSYWRTYPETGEEMNALEYSIYKWVFAWQDRYDPFGAGVKRTETSIQTFDNMRYLFLAINPELYMNYMD